MFNFLKNMFCSSLDRIECRSWKTCMATVGLCKWQLQHRCSLLSQNHSPCSWGLGWAHVWKGGWGWYDMYGATDSHCKGGCNAGCLYFFKTIFCYYFWGWVWRGGGCKNCTKQQIAVACGHSYSYWSLLAVAQNTKLFPCVKVFAINTICNNCLQSQSPWCCVLKFACQE